MSGAPPDGGGPGTRGDARPDGGGPGTRGDARPIGAAGDIVVVSAPGARWVESVAAGGPLWCSREAAKPQRSTGAPGDLAALPDTSSGRGETSTRELRIWDTAAWRAADLPLRAWARGRADRQIVARLQRRRLLDRLAAAWLRRRGRGARVVIAPSFAARHVFAEARALGAETVLVQDLPALRQLHADLDEASERHPGFAFLRRYRAPTSALARQEAEWVLARRVLVRGRYAEHILTTAGVDPARITPLPMRKTSARLASRDGEEGSCRVLLAGLATARNGAAEAAEAARRMGATLLVRADDRLGAVGSGRVSAAVEPADLLRRPGVEVASAGALTRLEGVDAVLAPAWVESYSAPVALAAAAGVRLVGTRRALGFANVRPEAVVAPGDVDAIVRALTGSIRAAV